MHPLLRNILLFCVGLVVSLPTVPHTASGPFQPDPRTPERLRKYANVQPLCEGFVDPTKPPYSAAGNGIADDSTALQQAIDDACTARMTVFLPAGTVFLLTKQLQFIQSPQQFKQFPRSFGFQMVGGGGTVSETGRKPILKLKDGSTVADEIFLKYQLTLNGVVVAQKLYNSRIRGVDIDLEQSSDLRYLNVGCATLFN